VSLAAPAGGAPKLRPRPPRPNRYRLALTPAGAGVLTLFFPGLLVAVASGQRPLMALSLGSALVLAVNAGWAWLVLRSVTVTATGPGAVTTGTTVPLVISLWAPRRLEAAVGAVGGNRDWVPVELPGQGELGWRAEHRGVFGQLTMRLQSSVPLGLTAVIRQVAVPLDSPIHAAPPSAATSRPELWSLTGGPASGAAGPSDVVGLRPYRDGDTQRDVHWPSVARTDRLMVRDRRPSAGHKQVTVVVRGTTDQVLDEVTARARGLVDLALADGFAVELDTVESEGGRRSEEVANRDQVVIRLARLASGATPPGPAAPLAVAVLEAGPGPGAGSRAGQTTPGGATAGGWLLVDETGMRWVSPA
jgi:uncharacterized protein (DUF58 family)